MFKIPYTPIKIEIDNIVYILDYGGKSGLGEDFDNWLIANHERISRLNATLDKWIKLLEDSKKQANTDEYDGL